MATHGITVICEINTNLSYILSDIYKSVELTFVHNSSMLISINI